MSDNPNPPDDRDLDLQRSRLQIPGKIITLIVTHAAPLVPEKFFDYQVALGEYGEERLTHISALDAFWHKARPIAFQVAGSYALPKALKMLGLSPDVIGIISHRKLITRSLLGDVALRAPHMRQIASSDLASVETSQTQPIHGQQFFVARPLYFTDGLILQYASCHCLRDLFDYMSLAVELGILQDKDLKEFALQKHLYPGGCELGYYPARWLLPTLEGIETVSRAFAIKFKTRLECYDHYQIRALSFLSERLGSFLLQRELRRVYGSNVSASIFGNLCTVVDEGHYHHGLSTEMSKNVPQSSAFSNKVSSNVDGTYLCETCVELGPNRCIGKKATQSSVGEWSRFQDPIKEASGAISGLVSGYHSFHTNLEREPWWMVDLREVISLKAIRIFNSEAAIARRAAKFVLEISLDERHWLLMHERTSEEPFGGYDGNPFVWKATQKVITRYVRIRLTTANWLHLDQVEVYGEPEHNQNFGTSF